MGIRTIDRSLQVFEDCTDNVHAASFGTSDEEIAFQKTTVHPESNDPNWEQQFTLPIPDAHESQLEITLW